MATIKAILLSHQDTIDHFAYNTKNKKRFFMET